MTKICGNVVTSPQSPARRKAVRLGALHVSAWAIAVVTALATTIAVPASAHEGGHGSGHGGGHGGGSHARSASISSGHAGFSSHGSFGHGGNAFARSASISSGREGFSSRGNYGRGGNSYARPASISSGRAGFSSHGSYGRGFGGRGYYGGGFRPFGPVFAGFGFFYDSVAAWPFLGLAAWELADYSYLNEEEVRAQENAVVNATSGPIDQASSWNDGTANGTVTPVREGHTANGQLCREFQQQVTVDGQTQQAYGTACQQPDGSWQMVNDVDESANNED